MAKKKYYEEAIVAVERNSRQVKGAARAINSYGKMGEGLSDLNTMRGGAKGFKGFVMEELEAAESSAVGRTTQVINNNGIADLKHIKTDGTEVLKQVKTGYKPGQIDFSRYKGQTVVVDKGNPFFKQLRNEGSKFGVKVVEGHVADAEAKALADWMQLEAKLTGNKNAVVTTNIYKGVKNIEAAHGVGMSAAKSGAIAGAGFSVGSNIVDVARGKKTVGEAACDVAVDTVTAGAVGYGAGVVGSAVASTAVGAAAIETAGVAAAAVSSAPVIGTAITTGAGALTAASGAVTAGATAVMGGVGSAASLVGAGGLVATVAPVAIAAAPFVAAGAVLGAIGSLFFDD